MSKINSESRRTNGKDNGLTKAERRDELLDSELDTVTGGVSDLGKYITKAVDDAISAA